MYQSRKSGSSEQPSVRDLQSVMNRLFDEVVSGRASRPSEQWPAAELSETSNALVVELDLPGVTKDDFTIAFEGGQLTVSGHRPAPERERSSLHSERWYGRFERTFQLPASVSGDKIKATMENGILQITLPKKEEAKMRKIPVTVG